MSLTSFISINYYMSHVVILYSLFAGYISETMKMGASLPAYRTFALDELKEATNNFDESSFISEGPHGQVCTRDY